MRRALHPWSGLVAVLSVWLAVTVASIGAQTGQDQEGVIRPRPVATPVRPDLAPGGSPLSPLSPVSSRMTQPPSQAAAGYAGQDTCMMCHEDHSLKGSAHGRSADPRTPAATLGCESCHGPGQQHVDDDDKGHIIRFGDANVAAREGNETCLSCHTGGTHALWEGSTHDARNLSCVTCHSVHAPKSVEGQLTRATQAELCAPCHRQQVAKMRRASHMPVTEGKMECTSCHDPHGATNVRLLKVGNWINESCGSCHAEKRGPFLHEHAAGRESCVSCHDPHGSPHERMLVAKVPMLCQRCHIGTRHPSTIYDQQQVNDRSNRIIGRGCVQCHVNIHGSNHPSGQTFLR